MNRRYSPANCSRRTGPWAGFGAKAANPAHVLEQISLILEEELRRRGRVSIRASGTSMLPLIQPDAQVVLERCDPRRLKLGDIVCCKSLSPDRWVLHRLYAFQPRTGWLLLKGDWRGYLDPPVHPDQVIARVLCIQDNPWPAPLWRLCNQLLIWSVVWPVALLVRTRSGREVLHQLKGLSRPAMFLDRVRRRLWEMARGQWRGYRATRSAAQLYRLNRSQIQVHSGPPCLLLGYEPGQSDEWACLLERVKHDHFGWGAGRMLTPGPEHPGWDLERDHDWLDFLLRQGFVVRDQRPGVTLELVF